ncbi:MAG: ATP-binding protein [Chitinispirillales bacterium]|nr:ATP-binding protein [Chitinispirillales bacterium]
MDKNLLKSVISDYTVEISKYVVSYRNIRFENAGNYVFVGMRRAGKSYLLYQRMQELLANGVKPHEMLYINFEDERLAGMESADLNLILETHLEMYGVKPILFLDEVQNVSGWEKFARRLTDTKYRVYISGSNAKMLSGEIQTTLGGRYIVVDVYPYDFKEYLIASNTGFSDSDIVSTRGRAAILREFNDYFSFGGLPESLMFSTKRDYLNSIYQKIYLGDIAARHSISNLLALRVLFKKLAESVKQPVSYNRIANIVSSTGAKISVNTVINYIEYAKDAWLITPIQNIAAKIVEKESKPKYYYTDNGILNLFLLDGTTSLFENLVAVNLLKIYGRRDSVFFYNKGIEVDFYLPETATAIQACYSLDNADGTADREINALLKISNFMECKKLLIITDNTEKTIVSGGKKIEVVPLWKWLLGL